MEPECGSARVHCDSARVHCGSAMVRCDGAIRSPRHLDFRSSDWPSNLRTGPRTPHPRSIAPHVLGQLRCAARELQYEEPRAYAVGGVGQPAVVDIDVVDLDRDGLVLRDWM